MLTSQSFSVNKLSQKGSVHIFLIIILLLGIISGVYLVQKTQIFKPKAATLDISNNPLFRERIENMRTTFNIPDEVATDDVEKEVKKQLLNQNIIVDGSMIDAKAQVYVTGECREAEQTDFIFSQYEYLPDLCFSNNDQEKAINLKEQNLAEVTLDFFLPYSEATQALALGQYIQEVRDLLAQSGIADRIELSSISGPDSKFDGYATTLIRLKELGKDVEENPDGSGKLTLNQEKARREYLLALRVLWEKQHEVLLNLAGHTARYILSSKAFNVANNFARPYTAPYSAAVSAKINSLTTPVALFLKNAVTH